MKKIFLFFSLSALFIFNSFSQDLSEPKGGGTLDIALIRPGDGLSLIHISEPTRQY